MSKNDLLAQKVLRLGTRGSALALKQTDIVRTAISAVMPELSIDTRIINTSGDWRPEHGETRLCEASGGKGMFGHEIEQAIQANVVDFGVHSAKDMPSFLPEGLVMPYYMPRANPFDAFVSYKYASFDDLPEGAVIGTSSVRRQSMLLKMRPDLKIVPLRGNVPTRLEKIERGDADATILAVAGLERLGLTNVIRHQFSADEMLPAAAQGAIGLEYRAVDTEIGALLARISCREATLCTLAERAALQTLDGSCRTPIGAYATLQGNMMSMQVLLASDDGSLTWENEGSAEVETAEDAIALGNKIAAALKPYVAAEVLSPA